jgi:hypothetical protein
LTLMQESEAQPRGIVTRTFCPSTLNEKLPACADALAISIAAIRTSFLMRASTQLSGEHQLLDRIGFLSAPM